MGRYWDHHRKIAAQSFLFVEEDYHLTMSEKYSTFPYTNTMQFQEGASHDPFVWNLDHPLSKKVSRNSEKTVISTSSRLSSFICHCSSKAVEAREARETSDFILSNILVKIKVILTQFVRIFIKKRLVHRFA